MGGQMRGTAPLARTTTAQVAPTHGCVRCGAQIPIEDAMCERCNPLGLRQPSASQAHGTAILGVTIAIVVLAVAARVMTAGIGPFKSEIAAVTGVSDGLRVTITLTNGGRTHSATTCRVDDARAPGPGPGSVIVQSPDVGAGQTVTFDATVTTMGTQPKPLTVSCGR
jgi:predicted nucleic acid-binding Zn ribbon protein